ncbi:MAG: dihydropteroate synthase [Candidatus Omnitrophota bacterium]
MKVTPLKISNIAESSRLMRLIGVDPYGIKIMAPKAVYYAFKLEGVNSAAANIIKQHLLSLGSDAAINRYALIRPIKTSLLIFGSWYQMNKLIERLKKQPFELARLASLLDKILKAGLGNKLFLKTRDKKIMFKRPLVCGIINMTPDSFSGDGLLDRAGSSNVVSLVLKKVERMVKDGAKMIDIGGESTRPFSKPVKEEEELIRIIKPIKAVKKRFPGLFISVDTRKFKVAKEAAEAGADIINDITALRASPKIASIIKKYRLGCILMHMKGTPKTMQINPLDKDLVDEIFSFLKARIEFCVDQRIDKEQIIADPGIGFGKTVGGNFTIIDKLAVFKSLGVPLCLGPSRKSFIGNTLRVGVSERLAGTIAAIVAGYFNGADILRVHDVKEASQALKIALSIRAAAD